MYVCQVAPLSSEYEMWSTPEPGVGSVAPSVTSVGAGKKLPHGAPHAIVVVGPSRSTSTVFVCVDSTLPALSVER